MHLVAITTCSRGSADSASPSRVSAAPRTYTSAVSKRFTPSSNARRTIAMASELSTEPPYVVQDPSEISDTLRPLRPSLR
jgi:hypothetical protein